MGMLPLQWHEQPSPGCSLYTGGGAVVGRPDFTHLFAGSIAINWQRVL